MSIVAKTSRIDVSVSEIERPRYFSGANRPLASARAPTRTSSSAKHIWAAIGVQFSRCAIRLIAHCCGEVATEIDVLGRRSEDPLNFASLALIGPYIKRTARLQSRGLRHAPPHSSTRSMPCEPDA